MSTVRLQVWVGDEPTARHVRRQGQSITNLHGKKHGVCAVTQSSASVGHLVQFECSGGMAKLLRAAVERDRLRHRTLTLDPDTDLWEGEFDPFNIPGVPG